MKDKIHPRYHMAKVMCACGATWETGSTRDEIHVDICSSCHPFYTGKQKLMDTEGRIERFNRKYKKDAKAPPAAPPAQVEKPAEKPAAPAKA